MRPRPRTALAASLALLAAGCGRCGAPAPAAVPPERWLPGDAPAAVLLPRLGEAAAQAGGLLRTALAIPAAAGLAEPVAALKDQLGFDFVVRFRGIVKVTSADGETKSAIAWTPNNGRTLVLPSAKVTKTRRQVGAVVCVKAKGMKEAWHLATSHADRAGAEIVALYSKRFTIEESFRDQKNLRFGMGLSDTRIGVPERRDRLLLVSAIAIALLTMLGAAGEAIGIDRHLKTNTVKRRTLSLLNQGLFHYAAFERQVERPFAHHAGRGAHREHGI